MPKRKRSSIEQRGRDPTQDIELRKENLEKKLVHGRKLLNKAFKTAKGFERQKLGKRIKLATEKKNDVELGRLQRELSVLTNAVDISKVAEAHLHKTILKSKSISELNWLSDDIKAQNKKVDLSQEEKLAVDNVTARLYNAKPVKETMTLVMSSIYAVLGISQPNIAMGTRIVQTHTITREKVKEEAKNLEVPDHNVGAKDADESANENEFRIEQNLARKDLCDGSELTSNSGLDEFSQNNGLIGGSLDEDSNADIDKAKIVKQSTEAKAIQRSRSPSVHIPQSINSPSPSLRPRISNKQSQQISTKSVSTFLPSLMGGYWSGSETATDDEEVAPRPKKNRPGQQARRAAWEKKYGAQAKHLQSGAPIKNRNKDWDPRRGARATDGKELRRGQRGNRDSSTAARSRVVKSTDDNSVPVKPQTARGMGRKDDVGPLHPSWEAAKKAKEAKRPMTFEGKKVVFD